MPVSDGGEAPCAPSPGAGFVGRGHELAAIARSADQVMGGVPWVVMVEGEAGVGKTALVRRAAEVLDGSTVWWANCDAAEQDYPFGLLGQWLVRVPPSLIAQLPVLSGPIPPGMSSIEAGAEVLRLLTARAGSGTDAEIEWEAVEGWRRPLSSGDRSEGLALTGLDEEEVGQLAAEITAPLSDGAATRLCRHTGGHPLCVRSILTEATEARLADPSRPLLPVPNSLTETVRRTLRRLTSESRAVPDALAVLDARVPLARAGSLTGVQDTASALGPLIAAGLVQWRPGEPSGPARIRHALQRDAMVAGTDSFDPVLAERLQNEAAQGRAARLLLWSAGLSSDRSLYEHRLLAATTHLLFANDHLRGSALQEAAEHCSPSPARTCVLGRLAFVGRGSLIAAEALFRRALPEAEAEHDLQSTAPAGRLGSVHVWWERGHEALSATRRAPLDGGVTDLRSLAYLQCTLLLACERCGGPETAEAELRDRIPPLPDDLARLPIERSSLLRPWGILKSSRGDLRACADILGTLTERQRSVLVADTRASDHFILAATQYQLGARDDAGMNAERALTLASTNRPLFGRAPAHASTALVVAARGDRTTAEERLVASHRASRTSELATDAFYPVLAEAGIAHAQDDPVALVRALRPLDTPALPGQRRAWQFWWIPLYTDALIATGDLARAEQVLQRIQDLKYSCPTMPLPWLTGRLAEAGGDLDLAERTYREALSRPPGPDENPLHRAGTEHSYGRLLLTRQDVPAAVEHLRAAHNGYQNLGATPCAERAAHDLTTAGVPQRTAPVPDVFAPPTERERAVALLVAQGMTNQETVKELHLGAKTVEYHLGHIFTKLDLTSRRQLRRALA